MTQNANPQLIRLCESLLNHVGEKQASFFLNTYPLSEHADYEQEFHWAKHVCEALEQEFDENQIQDIRIDCACGPELDWMNELRELYHLSTDIPDFVSKIKELNRGYEIKYEDKSWYLIYPQCYCTAVGKVDKSISRTWCYCTLGYTKRLFEHIFEQKVEVKLLESVKTGGKQCIIKIEIK